MSKFGRKPIKIGSVVVSIKETTVTYKGAKASGTYTLPDIFMITHENNDLFIAPTEKAKKRKTINAEWGLHRALLANALLGADKGFEKQIKIEGLGFKAQLQGNLLTFSLGFSHKPTYTVPSSVSIEVDKSGQLLTCRSSYKDILGQVCSDIRSLRPPEPYKGKGIRYSDEVILRKAGKAKS